MTEQFLGEEEDLLNLFNANQNVLFFFPTLIRMRTLLNNPGFYLILIILYYYYTFPLAASIYVLSYALLNTLK